MRDFREAARDDHGATAIEYGLICAFIIIAMMASLSLFAGSTTRIFNNVSNKVVQAG